MALDNQKSMVSQHLSMYIHHFTQPPNNHVRQSSQMHVHVIMHDLSHLPPCITSPMSSSKYYVDEHKPHNI